MTKLPWLNIYSWACISSHRQISKACISSERVVMKQYGASSNLSDSCACTNSLKVVCTVQMKLKSVFSPREWGVLLLKTSLASAPFLLLAPRKQITDTSISPYDLTKIYTIHTWQTYLRERKLQLCPTSNKEGDKIIQQVLHPKIRHLFCEWNTQKLSRIAVTHGLHLCPPLRGETLNYKMVAKDDF